MLNKPKKEYPKYSIRVAGMIIQNGKLLLVKGFGHEELWTPGGKLHENETDIECLKREFQEELKVNITKATFFKTYIGKSFYNPETTVEQRIYIVEIDGQLNPAAEIESFAWFTKEDLINKNFPMIPVHEKEILPDLIETGVW